MHDKLKGSSKKVEVGNNICNHAQSLRLFDTPEYSHMRAYMKYHWMRGGLYIYKSENCFRSTTKQNKVEIMLKSRHFLCGQCNDKSNWLIITISVLQF